MAQLKTPPYVQLRQLIDTCKEKDVLSLLRSTRDFISVTSPISLADRADYDDSVKLEILTDVSKGLQKFSDREHKYYTLCVDIINERLKIMERDKDPIFMYYQDNDNPLKSLIESDHLSELNDIKKSW